MLDMKDPALIVREENVQRLVRRGREAILRTKLFPVSLLFRPIRLPFRLLSVFFAVKHICNKAIMESLLLATPAHGIHRIS